MSAPLDLLDSDRRLIADALTAYATLLRKVTAPSPLGPSDMEARAQRCELVAGLVEP